MTTVIEHGLDQYTAEEYCRYLNMSYPNCFSTEKYNAKPLNRRPTYKYKLVANTEDQQIILYAKKIVNDPYFW
jgi:hypothetical protein